MKFMQKENGRSRQDRLDKNTSTVASCAHNSRVATPPLLRTIRRVQEWMKVAATLALWLFVAAEGRAQSALDGLDPGANNTVSAMAVQADGKILVGGAFTTLG